MRSESIATLFENVYERLDKYFQKRLKQAGVRFEMEYWKEELIQETYAETLKKLQDAQYEDYSVVILIFIKAGDVWASHARKMRKRLPQLPHQPVDEEVLKTRHEALRLEQKDEVQNLEAMADPESWRMLVMSSNGYPYGEIAKHFHTTESAVKMRISRLKEKLKTKR